MLAVRGTTYVCGRRAGAGVFVAAFGLGSRQGHRGPHAQSGAPRCASSPLQSPPGHQPEALLRGICRLSPSRKAKASPSLPAGFWKGSALTAHYCRMEQSEEPRGFRAGVVTSEPDSALPSCVNFRSRFRLLRLTRSD